MPKKVVVEVFGPDPPCQRCNTTYKVVEKAATELVDEDLVVEVIKGNITSPEVISRYGVLVSPAVAINGVVRLMGTVPNVKQARQAILKVSKE